MKKVINGRRYDTDTAHVLASDSYSNTKDDNFWEETLYRKNTGEFFLYGVGGPLSKYAKAAGLNRWESGSRIMPVTLEEAQEWAKEHLEAGKYKKVFGAIEEGLKKKTVTFSLPLDVIEKIKRESAKKCISMSEYITGLIRNKKY